MSEWENSFLNNGNSPSPSVLRENSSYELLFIEKNVTGAVTLTGFIDKMISIGKILLGFVSKKPEINLVKTDDNLFFSFNSESKQYEGWIPVIFQNNGNRVGTVYIENYQVTHLAAKKVNMKHQMFCSDQTTLGTKIKIQPNSLGFFFIKMTTNFVLFKKSPNDDIEEVEFVFSITINCKITVPYKHEGRLKYLKDMATKKIVLKTETWFLIKPLILTDEVYKQYQNSLDLGSQISISS